MKTNFLKRFMLLVVSAGIFTGCSTSITTERMLVHEKQIQENRQDIQAILGWIKHVTTASQNQDE